MKGIGRNCRGHGEAAAGAKRGAGRGGGARGTGGVRHQQQSSAQARDFSGGGFVQIRMQVRDM